MRLKQWNLDNDSMLKFFDIPQLSICRKYLKLTTMYNIAGNNSHFPPDIFVQQSFPYSTHRHANIISPFTRTQYMYLSFVPSVITTKNTLTILSTLHLFQHLTHCTRILRNRGDAPTVPQRISKL